MAGISFCKGIAYLDRSKPNCYGMPAVSREQQERAAVLARYFVSRRAPRLLEEAHTDALIDFRKGRKADAANTAATLMLAAPWQVVPVTAENVESYNDLGFFLEEGGKYKEAVPVLEEVTRAIPDRAPAFLNLGDAYAGLSDTEHARAAYRQYQKLMEQSGSGAKIPKRIQKYLGK
jgi:tetratricopeptide (TPR) repeat protein